MQSPSANLETKVVAQSEPRSHGHGGSASHSEELPPRSKSTKFFHETKYVMLNFMTLVPPDLYRGHVSASPESPALSSGDNFSRTHPYVVKSRSFDVGLHNRPPKLKHFNKLKSFQREIDSPASEDNLSYRYRQNLTRLGNHENFHSVQSDTDSPRVNLTKSQSLHSDQNDTRSPSPPSSLLGYSRMCSDASSSGDFTYFSDADDEYDDSNTSSTFSSRGLYCSKDGFLDLRRSLPLGRMPTLPSQSEAEYDECDGILADGTCESKVTTTTGKEDDSLNANWDNNQSDHNLEADEDQTDCEVGTPTSGQLKVDRSKLKLDIPCHPVQLNDVLVSLQTELNSELSELETEYEDAVKSARDEIGSQYPTALSPQSEAARILARIGDEVKDQYGLQISEALNRLLVGQAQDMTYEQFREMSHSVIDSTLPGWRQVALLMVYGQKIMWTTLQQGQKQFGDVLNFCSQLVADVAADFIIKEGGWGAVMNFDPSQSSDNQSSAEFDHSPGMVEYFTSHDITQVESGLLNNGDDDGNSGQVNIDHTTIGDGVNTEHRDKFENSTAVDDANDNVQEDLVFENAEKHSLTPDHVETGTHSNDLIVRQNEQKYTPSLGFDVCDQSEVLCESDDSLNCIRNKSDIKSQDESHESEASVQDNQNLNCQNTGEHGNIILDDSNQNIVSDQSSNTQTVRHGPSDYEKHSVYVKQETPTINVLSVVQNGDSKTEPDHSTGDDTGQEDDTVNRQHHSPRSGQSLVDGHEVCDLRESSDTSDVSEAEREQRSMDSNHVTDTRDFIGQTRRMGMKVVVIALALVTLGLGVRMATLNR